MNKPSGLARFPVIIALLALAACAKNPPPLYPINLSPAFTVGQKFSLVSDLSEKSQSHAVINLPGIAAPQNDERSETITGRLEGDGEVLGVFPGGGLQKLSLTITALKISKGATAIPNLPAAGAKIVASREGDKIAISVNGQAADGGVTALLNELITLDDEKLPLQDLYGTKTPVSVGATWPVNSTAIASYLKESLGGEFKDTNGRMKLNAVTGTGADQVEVISGSFAVNSFKPPLPATMTVDTGVITCNLYCSIPATTAKGSLRILRNMTMKTLSHGDPNGASVKLEISGQKTANTVMTFR